MSKHFLIVVAILACFCHIVGKSYACEDPDIIIYDSPTHTPLSYYDVGKEYICAYVVSGGPIVDWIWDWPADAYDTNQTDYSDRSIGECRFSVTGKHTVGVTGYNDWLGHDTELVDVYVFEMDLDIDDVDDSDEEDPGGYVAYNNDDDNDNGTPDREEIGTVTDEDDLVAISLSYEPSTLSPGYIELKAPYGGDWYLSVYTDSDKGTLVIPDGSNPYKRWPVGTQPSTLYVEGYNVGTAELWLLYTPDGQSYPDGNYNHDTVKFTIVEVEVFRDSSYSQVLDDWPKDGDHPRSPKYMFGEDDPIYVQATNLGTDPLVAEILYDFVKVTSESDTNGIKLTLTETGPNTQIFTNGASTGGGELLYLSTFSEEAAGDKIEVVDEEVLTFWLQIQPDSANYDSCYRVMVDRAEVGVEWQSDYNTYDPKSGPPWNYSTLNCADDFAQGFYNQLGTVNQVWFKNFDNGDLNSKESHWDSGGDSDYADSVDIAVWCGHGPVDTDPYMRFFVDKIGGVKQPADKLYWSEIDWGDKDMDWVVLNTCSFLNGTDNELKGMASGVHLICGYKTDMTVYCAAGDDFADRLDEPGTTIKQAWFDHAEECQAEEDENTARVFGASDCMSDSLGSTGPIQISRDPTSSSTYTHEDHDCW